MDLNENPILSLSPFGGWMTGLEDIYSMGSWRLLSYYYIRENTRKIKYFKNKF
jgi:hypothetical protein